VVEARRPQQPAEESDAAVEAARRLLSNIERVVVGKPDEVALVVAAFISGGHVLLEDVPGTAKTILARSLAQTIEGTAFARIQCTPDLQPTDVTGLSIFNQKSREFEFRAGPVFANVVLVDEVNRAMPRTQSALLEAMAEQQVTVDGASRRLPEPFLVIATENPIEQEGTFPLPEAQLDRFALQTALGYPAEDEEVAIVLAQRHGHPLDELRAVVSVDEIPCIAASGRGGLRKAEGPANAESSDRPRIEPRRRRPPAGSRRRRSRPARTRRVGATEYTAKAASTNAIVRMTAQSWLRAILVRKLGAAPPSNHADTMNRRHT
jgi:MoxR-like ATPase